MSKLEKTTYVEKINLDGQIHEIRKFKCPNCGNKELNYQIVGEVGYTSRAFNNLAVTSMRNSKHAICPKCGTSFKTKEYKRVRKTTYCTLTFFLGGIGVHKFYAKKTIEGLLYLAFCWTAVPGIIAIFYDFIVALSQKSDKNGMIWV